MQASNQYFSFVERTRDYLKQNYGFIGFVIFSIINLYYIAKYAVDVPFMDEWSSVESISRSFDFNWLIAAHNEHRIVFTKLQQWLLLQVNDWNIATNIVLNYFIFLAMLALAAKVLFSDFRKAMPNAFWGFFIFLLSPINSDNHDWGFQSQFHFFLLFSILTCHFLLREGQSWKWLLLGAISALAGIFSLSSGVITAIVATIMFIAFGALRYFRSKEQNILLQTLVTSFFIGGGVYWFLANYHKVGGHPPYASPLSLNFWNHFLNLISLGFGNRHLSWYLGLFALSFILFTLFQNLKREKWQLSTNTMKISSFLLCLLGTMLVISMGRANFGVGQAKSGRYFEFSMFLSPIGAYFLFAWLRNAPKRTLSIAMTTLWLFCLFFAANSYKFKFYRIDGEKRKEGLQCFLSRYPNQSADKLMCHELLPYDLSHFIRKVESLQLSFIKENNLL